MDIQQIVNNFHFQKVNIQCFEVNDYSSVFLHHRSDHVQHHLLTNHCHYSKTIMIFKIRKKNEKAHYYI